ncbi:MAG: acyltransferase family protein [Ilumatobacteraceae bacterium]
MVGSPLEGQSTPAGAGTAPLAADTPDDWRRRTFDDFIRSRSPGLDAVRLILAFLVLVSHTWPLGGFGREPRSPLSPDLTLGGFAVAGFFAISGMLVGRSALSRPTAAFARARAARIAPAFWTALLVGAFVVAPLGWYHAHDTLSGFLTIEPGGPVTHVLRGALFPIDFPYGITSVFVNDTPFGRSTGSSFVNGSLWTLPHEMRCYLVIGVVAVIARRWGGRRAVVAAWLVVAVLAVAYWKRGGPTGFVLDDYVGAQLVMFLFVFLSGAVVGLWADRVRLFGVLPLVALAMALLAGHSSVFLAEHVSGAALALVLPPIAAALEPLGRLLRGNDVSYGLYLYAWPVQQLIAMSWAPGGAATFVITSTACTLPLAAASWFLVERPVMQRWRRA